MVEKKGLIFMLNKVIDYSINNMKENVIVFIGAKIGINHLGMAVLLVIL